MKILEKIILVMMAAIAASAAILALFVLMTLSWPGLIVNPTIAGRLAGPALSRLGYDVRWKSVSMKASSISLLHHRYDMSFDDLCVDLKKVSETSKKGGCFRVLSVSFEIAWDDGFKIPSFGPLTASGGDATLRFMTDAQPETQPAVVKGQDHTRELQWFGPAPTIKIQGEGLHLPELVLPSVFRQTKFGEISIDIDRLALIQNETLRAGSFHLETIPNASSQLENLFLQAQLFEGFQLEALSGSARLTSASHFLENDWVLDASANMRQGTELSVDAEVEVYQTAPGKFSFVVTGSSNVRKGHYTFDMGGSVSSGMLDGKLSATAAGFIPEIKAVRIKDCPYSFHETEASSTRGRFRFECPMQVDLAPTQIPSATWTNLVTVPYNLNMTVVTDLETDLVPSMASRVSGSLDVVLVPVSQEILKARGHAMTRFSGVPADYPKNWQITSDTDIALTINRFQTLVRTLERTAFAVPAPVNALDGSIEFKMTGRTDLIRTRGEFPVTFTTRLKSENQSFDTDGKGTLGLALLKNGSRTDLKLDLALSSLRIVLPRFGLSSLPTLLMDSRIRVPKVMKGSNLFDYHLKITTPKDPARLVSSIVDESLPVFLDLNVEKNKVSGTIKVEKADLQLFRKKAELENLTIDLRTPFAMSEVNGRVRAVYADYKIDMWIQGTVGHPRVIFESEPPLPQEQMVAALLYGRHFGDLNATQSSSVADTSQAIAQNSVALGSLFLLVSTPVENVNYNPETGAFTVKVRLSEGTLLNVTTQEKKQQFGVRRNLTGNWVINTYIENDSEHGKQTGVALFEWLKRY